MRKAAKNDEHAKYSSLQENGKRFQGITAMNEKESPRGAFLSLLQ